MKKYKLPLISLTLLFLNSYSYSLPNFNNDSVIKPISSNNYNNLNGCPAVLKTETKTENCPTGYTGTISYKRIMSSDAVKFGDSISCEKGGKWSAWVENS